MHRPTLRPILQAVLTGCFLTLLGAPLAAAADSYLFTNGNVITMGEAGTVQADLRVVNQRIEAIGESLEARDGDVVVDMGGGYLMPGLAEMHAHVPAPDQGEQYRDDVLFLWVANGVTTARGMLGHPDHLALRHDLAAHRVLGPRLITSGPSFNGNTVSSPAQARQMVREQLAAGYDFLKIHPGLSRAQYDAMADEARRVGIPFAGHVPADVGLHHAVEQGQATIDHVDGFLQALAPEQAVKEAQESLFGIALADDVNLAGLPSLAAQMRSAGIWVVPTETLMENLADAGNAEALLERPEADYLPPRLRDSYRQALSQAGSEGQADRQALAVRKEVIHRLHDAGVGVLLGSDSPQIFNVPGFSIHRELKAMVEAGLSPLEALATGTTAPARFFGRADDFGQLATGHAADLVLLRQDPTADITHSGAIEGVMVRGRWLDRAALDEGLAEIARRYDGGR